MTFKQTMLPLLLSAVLMPTVQATTVPTGSPRDGRIQTVTYRPDDVVSVRAQVGRAIMIQLEADERLQGDTALLGMGDKKAWDLAVRGNNIVFKPTARAPATNLLVQTNKRTYAFALSLAGKKQSPTYILRFRYPDSANARARAEADKQARALDRLRSLGKVPGAVHNERYWAYGDKNLAPTAAYDNGRFTYFSFDNGREQPLIYKVMDDGTEALLNTHIEGDTVVIHETAKQYRLRLGRSVLAIENRGFNAKGSFNRTGTDKPSAVRLTR